MTTLLLLRHFLVFPCINSVFSFWLQRLMIMGYLLQNMYSNTYEIKLSNEKGSSVDSPSTGVSSSNSSLDF